MVNVMSDRTNTPITLVESLGCSNDEARIYILLLEKGVLSALSISRLLKMGRTKVYRILDKLKEKGLVVLHFQESGFSFEASSPHVLEQLVVQEEKRVEGLRQLLPGTLTSLEELMGKGRKNSKVLYYEGLEGVRQMTYNSIRSKGELLTMELGTLNDIFPYTQAEELRQEFVEARVKVRTLTNQEYIPEWTDNLEMVTKYWEIRQVEKDKFPIQFEILIYNNVYCLYRYEGKQIFGVEVYDDYLSEMQRSLFEYVWGQAGVFEVTSKRGEARRIKRQGGESLKKLHSFS
jgi:sugar-specific transcriptional regulator TrmB